MTCARARGREECLEEGSEKNLGRVSRRTDPFRLVRRISSDEGDGRDTQTQPVRTPEEQVALTLLIVTINGWNRVQVGFRAVHPVAKREAA